jgi:methylglutaconyl-CoA hydratase
MESEHLSTIILEKNGGVAEISLNRPEVRNAMNLQMIREITSVIELLKGDDAVRLILFRSEGAHFCSGADLKWMQSGLQISKAQLEKESYELARLFRVIWESAAVCICAVKGVISGGANGLLAASDMVLAESSAKFTFPEVKLGLIPATIAPYVMRKAGFSRTTDWMMTGRQIGAIEAMEAGLIHRICEDGRLEESTGILTGELLSGGVQALKGVKQLLRQLEIPGDPHETDKFTSRLIAGFRISPEGQEGMKAMLEKRKARWDEER